MNAKNTPHCEKSLLYARTRKFGDPPAAVLNLDYLKDLGDPVRSPFVGELVPDGVGAALSHPCHPDGDGLVSSRARVPGAEHHSNESIRFSRDHEAPDSHPYP
jgi:hypothetical protein